MGWGERGREGSGREGGGGGGGVSKVEGQHTLSPKGACNSRGHRGTGWAEEGARTTWACPGFGPCPGCGGETPPHVSVHP